MVEANVQSITSVSELLDKGETPEDILERIFKGKPYKILEKIETRYKCDCSRTKVINAMLSLGADEIQSLIDEDKPVETKCQFCNEKYEFSLDDLAKMRDGLKKKETEQKSGE